MDNEYKPDSVGIQVYTFPFGLIYSSKHLESFSTCINSSHSPFCNNRTKISKKAQKVLSFIIEKKGCAGVLKHGASPGFCLINSDASLSYISR